MADREYPWNIICEFFTLPTVGQIRAYPPSRLIDQPPLAKAEAMRADPDAYYAQVRAERDAEAEETR